MATIAYSSHHRILFPAENRHLLEEPFINPNSQSRLFRHCTKQRKDMISALSKSASTLAQNFFFYSGHNLTKHRELIFTLGLGPLHFPPSWHITVIYYTNYLLCLMKINIPIRALTSLMTVTWFGSSVMPSVRHHYAINSL